MAKRGPGDDRSVQQGEGAMPPYRWGLPLHRGQPRLVDRSRCVSTRRLVRQFRPCDERHLTADCHDRPRHDPDHILALTGVEEISVDDNLKTGAYTRKDNADVVESYERVMDLFPRLRERHKQVAGYMSGGEYYTPSEAVKAYAERRTAPSCTA